MPLDDLVEVIETLKQRIIDHGASLRENETRTRMALIDPLLQALGWEVSDPSLVTPEYSVGNGRADYALLNHDGRPAALLEAKHLSEPLERPNHQEQVFTYALVQQVKFAGLTDGNRWILDNVSDFIGERRILDFSISGAPAHQSALKLLLLWRPNLASGQPVAANTPVLATPTTAFVPVDPPQPDRKPEPAPLTSGNWTSLDQINNPTGQAKPTAIRFDHGDAQATRAWKDVFVHVADHLARSGILTTLTLPNGAGKSWNFISAAPKKRDGKEFLIPECVAGGIYVETHLSSKAAITYSKRLLTHCGVSPDSVELRFE